jgi:hypothetical protein
MQFAVKIPAPFIYYKAVKEGVQLRREETPWGTKDLHYLKKKYWLWDNWYNGAYGDTPWYKDHPGGENKKPFWIWRWYMRNTARNWFDYKYAYVKGRNFGKVKYQVICGSHYGAERDGGFHISLVDGKYLQVMWVVKGFFYLRFGWKNWRMLSSDHDQPIAPNAAFKFLFFKNKHRS